MGLSRGWGWGCGWGRNRGWYLVVRAVKSAPRRESGRDGEVEVSVCPRSASLRAEVATGGKERGADAARCSNYGVAVLTGAPSEHVRWVGGASDARGAIAVWGGEHVKRTREGGVGGIRKARRSEPDLAPRVVSSRCGACAAAPVAARRRQTAGAAGPWPLPRRGVRVGGADASRPRADGSPAASHAATRATHPHRQRRRRPREREWQW